MADESTQHGSEKTYQRGCKCSVCLKAHAAHRLHARKNADAPKRDICEICDKPTKVFWDHDHQTGSHRGWLCTKCNQALGLFEDNLFTMRRAVTYMKGLKK